MLLRYCSLAAVLAAWTASFAFASTPNISGGYRIGLHFLDSQQESPYVGWLDGSGQPDNQFYPSAITDPTSNAVVDGGLSGWSEAAARRAVVLAIEDAYRAVDTGNTDRTLAVAFYDGAVSNAGAGRRLNAIFADNVSMSDLLTGYSVTGAAFSGEVPNGSDVSAILVRNLDQMSGVQFTQSSDVINNIAGTAAHEIGHLFGLEHVPVGGQPPYAIMATGSTGLTAQQRLTVRRFETTLGTQGPGLSSASMLVEGIGTVAKSDFNMDGVTNVSGDGSVLIANLGRTNALFHEGDANNDHIVNISGDGSKFVAQLGTDILGPGQAHAEYNPATGEVLVSTNGVGFIEISSSLGQLIAGNAVPTNTAGLNALISDPFTSTTINYLNFSPLGTGGILDDFSLGAILPTGISDPSGLIPGALFRWSVVGGGEFSGPLPLLLIPEPDSFILASFVGIGLFWARRQRISCRLSKALNLFEARQSQSSY